MMNVLTTMEAVIRSVSTHQEALCVYVTKASICHVMTKLVKVYILLVLGSNCNELFEK